jgi:glutathione S-transferase
VSHNRVDDDLILFESRAIARYIARKAGSSLVTTEAHAAARFEQAVSTEASNFDLYAPGIAAQRVSNPRRGGKSDEARVAEFAGALAGKLEVYERILSRTEYLAGDELTIVDLFHLPYGAMLAPQGYTFLEETNKYRVLAYAFYRRWKAITSRPSWQPPRTTSRRKGCMDRAHAAEPGSGVEDLRGTSCVTRA